MSHTLQRPTWSWIGIGLLVVPQAEPPCDLFLVISKGQMLCGQMPWVKHLALNLMQLWDSCFFLYEVMQIENSCLFFFFNSDKCISPKDNNYPVLYWKGSNHIVFYVFLNLLYWNVVDLEYCVNFHSTVKGFSYMYIYIYAFFFFEFTHLNPLLCI